MFGVRALARRVFALETWKGELDTRLCQVDMKVQNLDATVGIAPSPYLAGQPEGLLALAKRLYDRISTLEKEVKPLEHYYFSRLQPDREGGIGPRFPRSGSGTAMTYDKSELEGLRDMRDKMAANEAKSAASSLSVSGIAARWGVDSLDAVRAVMQKKAGYIRDIWPLEDVEAVERKMLMPGAVMRFVGEGGLEDGDD